ncbi:MAG: GTP-binding protein [Planctomycetota bacterium]
MPNIDVKKRRIQSKVVYYGPGRSGKTSVLRYIHGHLEEEKRGRLAEIPTKNDPSLKLDVLPVRFGKIIDFATVFHLCSGPGVASAVSTRRLLLRDTDGIVFVADSAPRRRMANQDSFSELQENLDSYGLTLREVPYVVQYHKRDLEDPLPVAELREDLNPRGVPEFESSVVSGEGVLDALRAVGRLVTEDLRRRL